MDALPPELEPWVPDGGLPSGDRLLLPVVELAVAALAWQLDLPLWPDDHGRPYRVRPLDVVAGPHLERVTQADLSIPLDVTWRHDRYVVLDGVHRLLKAARAGSSTLPARVIPPEAIRRLAA